MLSNGLFVLVVIRRRLEDMDVVMGNVREDLKPWVRRRA